MSISFNDIPADNRVPLVCVEFDNSGGITGTSQQPYSGLIIGQRSTAAPVTAGKVIRITSADEAATDFGRGSMLARMVSAWLANNQYTDLYCIALDDNGTGVVATGKITVTGPATASGTINLYIAGTRVQVGVVSADTANSIATKIANAISANLDLPVTAAVNGTTPSQVDVTCRWKGESGNDIDIRVGYYDGESVLPAGVALTITAMASGATNPDISTALTAIAGQEFNVIVNPYTDTANLTALSTELDTRWNPTVQYDGIAVMGKAATLANLSTFGNTQNTPHFCTMGVDGSPTSSYEWAAAVAAIIAYEAPIDPARPFQTLQIKGVLPPLTGSRFTTTEQNSLLYDGISTFTVDRDGTVRIQRLITMYETNASGAEDPSYLDITTMLTLSYLRYDFRNMLLTKYPRSKLADDGTRYGAGQAIVTPSTIRAEAIARARLWEQNGLVEDVDAFKAGLVVERNANDRNRLDIQLTPDIINQFMVAGVQIKFIL